MMATAQPASLELHRARRVARSTQLQAAVCMHLRALRFPVPVAEFRFHHTRLWRLDLAWPSVKVGMEIDGGLYTSGKHARGAGIEADHEKRNAATAAGWALLYAGPKAVHSGTYLDDLRATLSSRGLHVLM
jgi:hypothetical protein